MEYPDARDGAKLEDRRPRGSVGQRDAIGRDSTTCCPKCKGVNVRGTYRVTGDGHRGISFSGVSRSAFGSRLQAPAVVMGRVSTAC